MVFFAGFWKTRGRRTGVQVSYPKDPRILTKGVLEMGQIKMYIENRDIPLPRCITMVHRLAPRLVSLCPCVASGTSALCYCKAWRIMAWVETP